MKPTEVNIQLYARPAGTIQWLCPACGEIHGGKTFIPWRRASLACRHCRKRFRIGVAMSENLQLLPPYNAVWIAPWNGRTVNVLGIPAGQPAIGRYRGRLNWICPFCESSESAPIDPAVDAVSCQSCQRVGYLQLILYPGTRGINKTCPYDWTHQVPYGIETAPQLSMAPSTTCSGIGA